MTRRARPLGGAQDLEGQNDEVASSAGRTFVKSSMSGGGTAATSTDRPTNWRKVLREAGIRPLLPSEPNWSHQTTGLVGPGWELDNGHGLPESE